MWFQLYTKQGTRMTSLQAWPIPEICVVSTLLKVSRIHSQMTERNTYRLLSQSGRNTNVNDWMLVCTWRWGMLNDTEISEWVALWSILVWYCYPLIKLIFWTFQILIYKQITCTCMKQKVNTYDLWPEVIHSHI